MSSMRKTVDREFDDVTVRSTELEFMDAADLLPEVAAVIAPGFADATANGDASAVASLIGTMARQLTGGKLAALLPRLLKGTQIEYNDDDGKRIKKELTSPANINAAFAGRKKIALGVVRLALEVNFADFFDGSGLLAASPKAP